MMNYLYKCVDGCGGEWEEIFPVGKAPPTLRCPNCGEMAKRKFVALPFFFRGGKNFY